MAKKPKVETRKNYAWEGRNKVGKKVSGTTPAINAQDLKMILLEQQVSPTKIRQKSEGLLSRGTSKVTSGDIALLTRQISTMIKSAVPIVKTFEIIAESTTNKTIKEVILDIKGEVESGKSLSESLRKYPKYFDELYCNLVHSAEQSGTLSEIFDSIAVYKEKTENIKKKIKKAMTYPISILVVAGIVTVILLLKVVPQFESMFNNFGAKLPAFTQFVLDLSVFMQAYWMFVFAAIGGLIFTFKRLMKTSIKFNEGVQRLSLKMPLFGNLLVKSCIARFARTLSTTTRSGVQLIEGLESAAGASGNVVYINAILNVKEEVSNGQTLSFALQSTGLFSPMVIQMTQIGEESGGMDEMLGKVASLYEEEVDYAVENLTSLMEPMIMAFLGVVVGGLIIAMYLPIFKMGSAV